MLGIRSVGLSLSLEKGLPLGSGLGSSATSAAAGAIAVNELFGGKLRKEELVLAGLKSGEKGRLRSDSKLRALGFEEIEFPGKKDHYFILVSPEFEAPTKKMRAALSLEIGMADFVWNSSQAVALAAAVLEGDVAGLGKALFLLKALVLVWFCFDLL